MVRVALRRTLIVGVVAFGSACSEPDSATEETLGRVQQALTLNISGHTWTSTDMGTCAHAACAQIVETVEHPTIQCPQAQWDFSNGVITGANAWGRGLATVDGDPDDCKQEGTFDSVSFLSRPVQGDFELVVRVTSITGMRGSEVGVMLRENLDPLGIGPAGALELKHDLDPKGCDTGTTLTTFARMSRAMVGGPADPELGRPSGRLLPQNEWGPTRMAPPFWLRIERVGNDYVTSRANDDNGRPKLWIPGGGGEFQAAVAYVGPFVSSLHGPQVCAGDPTPQIGATATFDNLSIRTEGGPRYRSGWVGSSAVKQSTGIIGNGMNGYYVDRYGLSYKYADTNEQLPELQLFENDGSVVRLPGGDQNDGYFGGGIGGYCEPSDGNPETPPNCAVYVAQRSSPPAVLRKTRYLESSTPVTFPPGDAPQRIRGVSADGTHVFVSDYGTCETCSGEQSIRVIDATNLEQIGKCQFDRPGPSAVDHSGQVWVIRPATVFPLFVASDAGATDLGAFDIDKHAPAIECLRLELDENEQLTCVSCGSIPDLANTNPTGLAFDPNENRLFVTENGPAQNVRIYDISETSVSVAGSFGEVGGAFSGPHPGLLEDPDHGGDHRLYSPLGVGLDDAGNIYVASSAPRTTIQKFPKIVSPANPFHWGAAKASAGGFSVYGLGREIGAFDVDPDGETYFYTRMRRLALNPSSPSPDFDWKPHSIIRPPYSDLVAGVPAVPSPQGHFSQGYAMRLRRIGGKRFLYELSTNSVNIYRFADETAGPGELLKSCGSVKLDANGNVVLWVDTSGDGQAAPDDFTDSTPLEHGGFTADVSEDGSIWLTAHDWLYATGLWELRKPSISANGVPMYQLPTDASDMVDLSTLGFGNVTNGLARFVDEDLYLLLGFDLEFSPALRDCPGAAPNDHFPTCPAVASCNGQEGCCLSGEHSNADCIHIACRDCGAKDCPSHVAHPHFVKFADWHGARTLAYSEPLATQLDSLRENDDFAVRYLDPDTACQPGDHTSFDVAGDKLFAQIRYGTVFIHDAGSGKEVDRIDPGPEVSGLMGWADLDGTLQVHKRPNSNEYLMSMTDSHGLARNLVLGWKPADRELGEECWDRHQCLSGFCENGICCETACRSSQCIDMSCVNIEGMTGQCLGTIHADESECNDSKPETVDDQCRSGVCAGASTSPSQFPFAWYVASPDDVVLVNGEVATWRDRGGGGLDLWNDFYLGRPVYNATGWNETNPTLSFDGMKLLRRTGSWTGAPGGTDRAFSVLAVIRSAVDHNGSVVAWWATDGTNIGSVRCSVVTSNNKSFFNLAREDDFWAGQNFSTPDDVGSDRHVVAWRFSPESLTIDVDGTSYESSPHPSLGQISLGTLVVGARTELPTWLFQGDISELMIIPSRISDEDVKAFRMQAQNSWGGLP